jgi:hypothetical protein
MRDAQATDHTRYRGLVPSLSEIVTDAGFHGGPAFI